MDYLRYGIALVLITFGIDQLLSPQLWLGFMPPWAMMFASVGFMYGHAIFNILLGLVLASGYYTKETALAVTVWLLMISFGVFFVDWRTAIRDIGLTAAALSLQLRS